MLATVSSVDGGRDVDVVTGAAGAPRMPPRRLMRGLATTGAAAAVVVGTGAGAAAPPPLAPRVRLKRAPAAALRVFAGAGAAGRRPPRRLVRGLATTGAAVAAVAAVVGATGAGRRPPRRLVRGRAAMGAAGEGWSGAWVAGAGAGRRPPPPKRLPSWEPMLERAEGTAAAGLVRTSPMLERTGARALAWAGLAGRMARLDCRSPRTEGRAIGLASRREGRAAGLVRIGARLSRRGGRAVGREPRSETRSLRTGRSEAMGAMMLKGRRLSMVGGGVA